MTATGVAAPARRKREAVRVAVKTTIDAGHGHCALFVSDTGDGRTSVDDGHFHRVAGLEVLPARGHTHELSDRRCVRRHATETGNHIG
jgi:hypothetical protein